MKKKKDKKVYSIWNNWHYILKIMIQYDNKTPAIMICLALISFFVPLVGAVIPSVAVKLVMEGGAVEKFTLIMTAVLAIYLLLRIAENMLNNKFEFLNYSITNKVFQQKTVQKILYTDYSNIENSENQKKANESIFAYTIFWTGIPRIIEMMVPLIFNMLGIIVYGILLVKICPWLLLVFAAMAALNVLLSTNAQDYYMRPKVLKVLRNTSSKIRYFYHKSTSVTEGKDIRIYKMEEWFKKLMAELIKQRLHAWRGMELSYFFPNISDTIFSMIRDLIAYSILISLFIKGEMDATTFTLYLGIINGFAGWLSGGTHYPGFTRALGETIRCQYGVSAYRTFLEIKERDDSINEKKMPDSIKGAVIEFKDVSFTYPGSDQMIINHMNLKLSAGEKVALVGVNGAGKTTLVKLMCGFYHPTSGEIFMNGEPVSKYSLKDYQKTVGAVFQDMMVIAFSIAENIACCKPEEIDYERMWQCLSLAGLREKVESLPQKEKSGVTTFLDEAGISFSGGELQKLLLARALYKDTPLILLDEPTSALDPLAESQMYEKYNELTQEKTAVFISHRLASTKFCSRILYFNHGRVEESGSHEELIRAGGEYAKMFALQSQYYSKDDKEELAYE